MPKIEPSKREMRCRQVRGIISKWKEIKKKSDKDLAKAAGKNPRFMETRNGDPGTFRLDELWSICDTLGIPPDECLEIIGGKRGNTNA